MKQAIENQRMNVNRATAVKINTQSSDLMQLDPSALTSNSKGTYSNHRKTQINPVAGGPRGAANDQQININQVSPSI